MTHEKLIKDQRGKVRIQVTLVTFTYGMKDVYGNEFRYDVQTSVVAPRKRIEIWDNNIATSEEILQTKKELWQKINPEQQTKQ